MEAATTHREAESLLDLVEAAPAARALEVVADIGLADLLPAEPDQALPVAELAAASSTNPVVLEIVLRLLAGHGLFTEPAAGQFGLTARGALLRSDHPMSVRSIVRLHAFNFPMLRRLDQALRTGQEVGTSTYGKPMFVYLQEHPEWGAIFDAAGGDLSRLEALAILAGFDFSPYRSIVDVGGGNGSLLASVLPSRPDATDRRGVRPAAPGRGRGRNPGTIRPG